MLVNRYRILDHGTDAVCRIGLAQNVAFVGKYSIVVCRATPQHGTGGHEASLDLLHSFQVARTARVARHPQIARIDEADELFGFLIELRVRAFWIIRVRRVPDFRKTRADVRTIHRHAIQRFVLALVFRIDWSLYRDVAAVTIGAAQYHGRIGVHGVAISAGMARYTAGRFLLGILHRLAFRCRRMTGVFDYLRLLLAGSVGSNRRTEQAACEQ